MINIKIKKRPSKDGLDLLTLLSPRPAESRYFFK